MCVEVGLIIGIGSLYVVGEIVGWMTHEFTGNLYVVGPINWELWPQCLKIMQ